MGGVDRGRECGRWRERGRRGLVGGSNVCVIGLVGVQERLIDVECTERAYSQLFGTRHDVTYASARAYTGWPTSLQTSNLKSASKLKLAM